jgi:hypothetical protein
MVTQDDDGNVGANIGNSGATTPTQIQISNMTVRNTVAYGGISLDRVNKAYINNVKFQGSYSSGGADASNSKGVTVTNSTAAYSTTGVVFNQCQFTKFARLVDISYDATNIRFHDCDFSTAYYGSLIGAEMDGSTAGLIDGPRDMHFANSSWSNIGQQAIWVKPTAGADAGTGPRNIISNGNYYSKTVANNFEGAEGSIREVPVIQFDNDECTSTLDFFERSDLRESTLNAAPELQGIGRQTKPIRSFTMSNNQSSAATIREYPGLNAKGITIEYKIERGGDTRVGRMDISSDGTNIAYDDNSVDSDTDVGVDLIAALDNKDSTAGNETIKFQYQTTNLGTTAVINYQVTISA